MQVEFMGSMQNAFLEVVMAGLVVYTAAWQQLAAAAACLYPVEQLEMPLLLLLLLLSTA
jgi:hypothetical protein